MFLMMEQDTPTFDAWFSSKRSNLFGLIVSDKSKLSFNFTSSHKIGKYVAYQQLWQVTSQAFIMIWWSLVMIVLLILTSPALKITKNILAFHKNNRQSKSLKEVHTYKMKCRKEATASADFCIKVPYNLFSSSQVVQIFMIFYVELLMYMIGSCIHQMMSKNNEYQLCIQIIYGHTIIISHTQHFQVFFLC